MVEHVVEAIFSGFSIRFTSIPVRIAGRNYIKVIKLFFKSQKKKKKKKKKKKIKIENMENSFRCFRLKEKKHLKLNRNGKIERNGIFFFFFLSVYKVGNIVLRNGSGCVVVKISAKMSIFVIQLTDEMCIF